MSRWQRPRWGSTEWRHPDGRTMDVPRGIEPHAVVVEMSDGTTRERLVPAREGLEVTGVLVDGERYGRVEPSESAETGTE